MSAQEAPLVEEMFVQVAHGASASPGSLTLHGIGPSTLYFSDRPERLVGHMTTGEFVEGWTSGPNSFAEDPPNAVLSFIEPDADAPSDVVMVLREPELTQPDLGYAVEVLEGQMPTSAGPCTLFIDPLGRPLSPGSVAGVRRRERRRERRRF
jgi:hypothetical protein